MNKSSRVHALIRGGGGGGGGGGRGPTARQQSGQRFLVLNYFTVFRWDPIFSMTGRGGGGQLLPGAGPDAFYRNPYNL